MAFPTGYTKYQEITIDHTKVVADLTDFIVAVNLADLVKAGADVFDTCRTDGGDIRATKTDGTTELAVEIAQIDTTAKTGVLYVKFTGTLSSSTDTVIRIWYNGTDTLPAVTATYGRNAVWSAVRGVWHFNHSSGDATDSTGSGSTGVNTSVTYTAGKLGNAAVYNGSAYHTITDNSTIEPANAITFGGWIYMSSASSFQMIMAKGENAGDTRSYEMRMYSTTSQPEVQMRSGASYIQARSATAIGTSTWAHVLYTRSGSSHQIYINGISVTLSQTTTQTGDIAYSTDNLWFGQRNGGLRFNGRLNAMRLWATQLSSSWVGTEYNNQNSPSTFYAVGAEVSSGISISPSVQVLTFSLPQETITAGAVLPVNAQAITFSIPAYAVSGKALVSVNAQTATFSIPTYLLIANGISLSPDAQALTFSIPTYSVLSGAVLDVGVSTLTFSVPTATITGGATLGVNTQSLTFTIPTLAFIGALWRRSARATSGADWTRSAINND